MAAGILQRSRHGHRLRVTHRFLDHAETVALLQRGTTVDALRRALSTWDDFHGDPHHAAVALRDLLDDRHQLGRLAPAFPTLEGFAAAC